MSARDFDEIRDLMAVDAVEKFNPYHDRMGRFSTAGGAASFTIRTKDPRKQSWADKGIEREKVRTSKEGWDKPESKSKPKSEKKSGGFDEKGVPRSYVSGKDIVDSFEYDQNKPEKYKGTNTSKSLTDVVAEKQGYKGKPTVVSKEEFNKAAQQSGLVAYRTMAAGTDVISGERTSGGDFAKKLLYGDENEFALNGSGAQAMGGGIYFAVNAKDTIHPGTMPDGSEARWHSVTSYGGPNAAVVSVTLSPNAKICDYYEMQRELSDLPNEVAQKFNYDVGAYAAAKGYDAVRAMFGNDDYDYLTVVNRTALIVSETIENSDGNAWKG